MGLLEGTHVGTLLGGEDGVLTGHAVGIMDGLKDGC